ncbi:MAG: hypothetical protein IT379_16290 [Deltaproteobacteria bacterium]|nr:hypothetical protein [Deltaproteobacteria bacterium]
MRNTRDDGPGDALARLNALRAEHKPILEAIVADPGMAPNTRSMLVAHLMEEEDERMAEVEAAGLDVVTASAEPTVGALTALAPARERVVPRRGDDGSAAGGGLTIGSLRRAGAPHAWRRDR